MTRRVREDVKKTVIDEARKRSHYELCLFPEDDEPRSEALVEAATSIVLPLLRASKAVKLVAMPGEKAFEFRFNRYVEKVANEYIVKPEFLLGSEALDLVVSDQGGPLRGCLIAEISLSQLNKVDVICKLYDPAIITNIGSVIGSGLNRKLKDYVEKNTKMAAIVFSPFGIRTMSVFANHSDIGEIMEVAYQDCRLSAGFLSLYGG